MFSLAKFKWLGFDLDHTMVRYKLKALHSLIHSCLWKFLVQNAGYPEELAAKPLDWGLVHKGLLVDRQLGNILKLNRDNVVVSAFHGHKPLSHDEIVAAYPKPVQFDGHTDSRMWSMATFFEGSFPTVFATLVEYEDGRSATPSYAAHAQAVYDGVFFNFADWTRGWFFSAIAAEPAKFLHASPRTRSWLQDLQGSHRLALITNSLPEYTALLMDFALGAGWERLFSLVVFEAKKPGFWISPASAFETKLHAVDRTRKEVLPQPLTVLQEGKMYRLGSILSFTEAIGDDASAFCYFGDHLLYDVIVPKQHRSFAAVAIVEELEDDDLNAATSLWGSFFEARAPAGRLPSWWYHHARQACAFYAPSVEWIATHIDAALRLPAPAYKYGYTR
jgi:HAD superfamily 5'-nucleotidase-like hydrolase